MVISTLESVFLNNVATENRCNWTIRCICWSFQLFISF